MPAGLLGLRELLIPVEPMLDQSLEATPSP